MSYIMTYKCDGCDKEYPVAELTSATFQVQREEGMTCTFGRKDVHACSWACLDRIYHHIKKLDSRKWLR